MGAWGDGVMALTWHNRPSPHTTITIMRLCLASLALSISLVNALDVFVHPTPRISPGKLVGKEEAAAVVSHHLGLDMFESLPRKVVFTEQVNGDFVAKGDEKRNAALVVTSENALKGMPRYTSHSLRNSDLT